LSNFIARVYTNFYFFTEGNEENEEKSFVIFVFFCEIIPQTYEF